VDSALGSLHHVDVGSVTNVLGAVCVLEMLPALPTSTWHRHPKSRINLRDVRIIAIIKTNESKKI
jgi:hypothetical protein